MARTKDVSNSAPEDVEKVSTQVPGVDMSQVIASKPYMVKENAIKIKPKKAKTA
jgi:hypothetical protein